MSGAGECARIRLDLGVYLLGVIAPADRAMVNGHLASCPRCRDELAGLAALPALLRKVPLAAVRYAPQPWGTELEASVSGVPPGTACQIWATTASGHHAAAGGWTVTRADPHAWYPRVRAVPGRHPGQLRRHRARHGPGDHLAAPRHAAHAWSGAPPLRSAASRAPIWPPENALAAAGTGVTGTITRAPAWATGGPRARLSDRCAERLLGGIRETVPARNAVLALPDCAPAAIVQGMVPMTPAALASRR